MSNLLQVHGLDKSYGSFKAVKGLDLTVEPGTIVGLIGPNGAGKSTLIRAITGIIRPDKGLVRLFGDQLPGSENARSRLGYMPQRMAVYEGLSVLDNLRFFGRLYGLEGKELDERIGELLGILRLESKSDSLARELSGGMMRRLMLATAVIHDPELMLLDEPTAGVDPLLRLDFWIWFRTLAGRGRSILISTHHIAEAVRCDRVLFLRTGTVLDQGEPKALIKKYKANDLEQAFVKATGEDSRGH